MRIYFLSSARATERAILVFPKLDAEQEVKEKLKKEIERFKNVSSNSSESAVIRGYIETLLELPWNKASKDNKNLGDAERILDEDHCG